jgi:hypothetical protein
VWSFAGELFVIGGGTGILDSAFRKSFQNSDLKLNFLITRFAWDHSQGLSFVAPLYRLGYEVTYYSGSELRTYGKFWRARWQLPTSVNFEFMGGEDASSSYPATAKCSL